VPVAVPNRAAVLVIVLVSYLMIVLDISIVITALPRIRLGLGFTEVGLSWVQSASSAPRPFCPVGSILGAPWSRSISLAPALRDYRCLAFHFGSPTYSTGEPSS
jgi:hypothetical protein